MAIPHLRGLLLAPLLVLAGAVTAQQVDEPSTGPELSAHTRMSSPADVAAFLDACLRLPAGDRLHPEEIGRTSQGRVLQVVRIAANAREQAPPQRLRVLVLGDIHAGEVEGKEALLMLLREFARGDHRELLDHAELWFLPVYNADGDAAVGPHREGQNGPDLVGTRENGQGLDLNRDFVKAEAPETQALLRLIARIDPHLFVDLHTTNGSYHGYHLTFAPSLALDVDPELATLHRTLLDDAQRTMQQEHGLQTFDYGNFETRERGGERGWYSYDHRPRYLVNGFGLRNRLAVLSEAYSYCDFATRIAATRAFVLTLLRHLVARREQVLATTAAADARRLEGTTTTFGFAGTFAPPETLPVLVSSVDEVQGGEGRPLRRVRKDESTPTPMPVCRRFDAQQRRVLPAAWAIEAPSPAVLERLQLHGVKFETLTATRSVRVQRFAVTGKRKPKRPYQGHQELQLVGHWQAVATVELPIGAVVVPQRQRLARLAAQLLEPESDDSLSTWNFFEAATDTHHPVLRVLAP